ncbi:MAG TPA: permease-like cell division protein FtsX [Candidatus Saccharimonadales bacterium]|nr:permease-like cell division protein FtsX [Candidatus Saccharimonadales bacterium]
MNRKFITFTRIVRTGVNNFVRNAWLSIAAMAVMIITLTIVLFSLITNATFSNTIAQITAKIDVSVYLKDGVSQKKVANMLDDLRALPDVQGVTYLNKLQALDAYKKQNAGNTQLLSAINQTDNPIPATIRVKPRDLNRIPEIQHALEQGKYNELIDQISYNGDRKAAIDKIAHATNLMKRAGIVAVGIFLIISVLIIFNTIQMAIFNRRDELTIMRLLGASTGYIRGPFVVEAIMYGIISALVSVLLIHSLFVASSSALQATSLGLLDINYASTYFNGHFVQLLTLQLGLGILIGAASSTVATRRYLKFKTSK